MVKHFISQVKTVVDKDTLEGTIGATMAVCFPLMDFLTKVFQFVGAFAGLILLYLAIRHKILEINKLKKEQHGRVKR